LKVGDLVTFKNAVGGIYFVTEVAYNGSRDIAGGLVRLLDTYGRVSKCSYAMGTLEILNESR